MAEATDASVRCSWEDAGAGVGRDAPPLSDAFKSTASTLKNRHNMSHVSHVFYIKCFKCLLLLQILSHNQTECSRSWSQHLHRWRALKKGVPSIDFARWTVSDKFWVRQGGGHFSGRRWHSWAGILADGYHHHLRWTVDTTTVITHIISIIITIILLSCLVQRKTLTYHLPLHGIALKIVWWRVGLVDVQLTIVSSQGVESAIC